MSVTTDGFITDIENLEYKLNRLPGAKTPLLKLFQKLRGELNDDEANNAALEIKHKSKGIISYSTRGQVGQEQGIKATTGFQSSEYSNGEIVTIFKEVLRTREKEFEYTQARARSAKDVFTKGGHVTILHRDQKVRLLYDNRRSIIEPKGFVGYDMSNRLLDSVPFKDGVTCYQRRFLSRFAFKTPYLKASPISIASKSQYRSYFEIAARNLVKGYLAPQPCFKLRGDEFASYKTLSDFIYAFEQPKSERISYSKQAISNIKHRRIILRPVPKTRENLAFARYIQTKLPHFDIDSFLKK